MTIVISALQYLGYVLIFPGFLFCFFAGLLLTVFGISALPAEH